MPRPRPNTRRPRTPTEIDPFDITDRYLPLATICYEVLGNTQSRTNKGKAKGNNTGNPSNSDLDVGLYSHLIGDIKQIKLDAGGSFDSQQSTTTTTTNEIIPRHPRQLPNEILSLIINHLSEQQGTLFECAVVTKQYHAIANPILWKAPEFYCSYRISERFLACISDNVPPQRLATLGQHIHELHLFGHHWTDAALVRLIPHIPNLEHLAIYNCTHITDTSFQHVPRQCQHLTRLQLLFMQLSVISFSAIGTHCHRLTELKLEVWSARLHTWLNMLTACPLEKLDITTHSLPMNEIELTVIQRFDRLTSLTLSGTTPRHLKSLLLATPFPPTMTNTTGNPSMDSIRATAAAAAAAAGTTTVWPQLTTLHLSDCYDLDDTTLIGFMKTHPHLRELALMQPRDVSDASLDAMAVWLPNLTRVTLNYNGYIKHMSPEGIRRLVRLGGRSLEYIKIGRCQHLLPNHFPELVDYCNKWGVIELDQGMIHKVKQDVQGVQASGTNNNNNNNNN